MGRVARGYTENGGEERERVKVKGKTANFVIQAERGCEGCRATKKGGGSTQLKGWV